MKLDLRTFKKVHEDGDKAVLEHADGHEIHISKSKLGPEQCAQLQALPFRTQPKKMAEGGPVEDTSISSEEWKERWGKLNKGARKAYADGGEITGFDRLKEKGSDESASFYANKEWKDLPQYAAMSAGADGAPQVNIAEPESQPFSADPIQPYGAAQDPVAGISPGDPSLVRAPAAGVEAPVAPGLAQQPQDPLAQDSSQYTKGKFAEAAAEGQLGKEQEGIENKLAADSQNLQKSAGDEYNAIKLETDQVTHDMKNNLIDPNRYLASKSTGDTILGSIGLLLGGLGQGGGGPNVALKVMDDAINRDIAAQEKNMGQRQSLLDANFKKYGVLNEATARTRIQMRDVATAHLEAAAAKAKDPIAKARALQGAMEFKAKNDKEMQDLAIKKAELGAKQAAARNTQQENFIPAIGGYATTKEGAAKVNELAGATRTAQAGIGDLLDLAKKPAASIDPITRAKADTIASTVKAALRVPILGPGTVNDKERALLDKIVANPATIFSLDALNKERLKTLSERLESGLSQQAKAYGAQGGGNSSIAPRLSTKEQGLKDWADANPTNPAAKQVLERLKKR